MGFNRRSFIQLAAGGVTGILFTPAVWKATDDVSIWTQNWSWIPRVPKGEVAKTAGLSKLCPSGCAVQLDTVGGKVYMAEGNEENPLSKGGVCPLCASAVQMMHSPSRVEGPMMKDGSGKLVLVTWEQAESALKEKLAAAKGKVALVSGDETGTANEVLSGFVAGLGGGFYAMPGEATAAGQAAADMFGEGQIGYDLENADFVLSLGANLVDFWGPTVRNARALAETGATFVYAGPSQNRSCAIADQWVPAKPGSLAALALGVASSLIAGGRVSTASGFGQFKSMVLADYTPEKAAAMTGVPVEKITKLASDLNAAAKPVVVGSGDPATYAAASILNILLGRFNVKGGMSVVRPLPKVVDAAVPAGDFAVFLADVAAGKAAAPEVLMAYECNPAYALPESATMQAALGKAGFLVSFGTYMDETAAMADMILPNPHTLERLDDVQTPFGLAEATYCLGVPAAASDYKVVATTDLLLKLAPELGADLGYETFQAVLEAKVEALGADWDELAGGAAWVAPDSMLPVSPNMAADTLASAKVPASEGLLVDAAHQLNIGSPSIAIPPHNQVTIFDTELRKKDMFVKLNGNTAKSVGVKAGDMVKLTSAKGECMARVRIYEGVMDGVVAVLHGFGHTAWDEFSRGKGDNVNKILTVSVDADGNAVSTGSAVTIAKS